MGFCAQEIVSWYQKKIGTYDKQQWEKTVEQRILSGFTHVPKKTAKLKTDLIDVDLVRGSSFTKAKPKHGLVTVTRLAVLRLVFLPVYSRWWLQQTSPRIFAVLLLLYLLQLFNTAFFICTTSHHEEETTERITMSEVLVPAIMMLGLSVMHSQIVSPHTSVSQNLTRCKSRRFKRTKRRIPPTSRSRSTMCCDTKSSTDIGSELVAGSVDCKFNKPIRLRSSSSDEAVFNQSIKKPIVDVCVESCSESSQTDIVNHTPLQKRKNLDCGKANIGLERLPLDDDGFESLNGNGSSDNNEEENNCDKEIIKKPSHINEDLLERQHYDDLIKSHDFESHECSPNVEYKKSDLSVSFNSTDSCNVRTDDAEVEFHRDWLQYKDQTKPLINVSGRVSSGEADIETDHKDTDSELSEHRTHIPTQRLICRRRGSQQTLKVKINNKSGRLVESSFNSSAESEDGETGSFSALNNEGTTSAGEWIGVTTNSEECSYSSDMDDLPTTSEYNDHPYGWDYQMSPTVILSPSCAASDKVSCTIWENREVKKAELSILDISSAIIARVEAMPENMDYFYAGMVMSSLLAAVPSICRLSVYSNEMTVGSTILNSTSTDNILDLTSSYVSYSLGTVIDAAIGNTFWERCVVLIALFERWVLACFFFFFLAVAERTFKQRFLYAKFFSHLTSFRRARKSELPHFRLNKVRNIKSWLSIRSYLKKRGPQRSVDMIVSASFLVTLLLLSFLSVELLKDSVRLHSEYNVEALAWCLVLGFFLLRFMTLGTKINRKYRNLSTLITEQINLYLQIEQKPNKKEELMVANSVLKLAADLLKELESPFKISGLSANPYLYTITKVVILSALSGVLSEMLGFKLKLHKIKIK